MTDYYLRLIAFILAMDFMCTILKDIRFCVKTNKRW